MKRTFHTEYPENPPEWYWKKGLHDAFVVGVEAHEIPFDYNQSAGQKSRYDRNVLTLKLDAKGAMFDFCVQKIRFFNYKILPESFDPASVDPTSKRKLCWLADKLTEESGRYVLDILLEDYPEQFHLKLRFDRAEVDRE